MPVHEITSGKEFREVLESNDVVFVDFYADWCGPCKAIAPVIDGWSDEDKYSKVKFCKLNVDDVGDVSQECGIQAMPTFMVFKKGEKDGELVGAHRGQLTELLAKAAE